MKGYKALDKDFTTHNNFKYEIGKIYELSKDEKLKICESGFHFCANPIDVYGYYIDDAYTKVVEVLALGEIVHQGTKYATDRIKIIRECSKDEIISLISSGENNTGSPNTGDYNSGQYNSGSCNTGCYNSGKCNCGDYNYGNYNTGDSNIGNYNSGHSNNGSYNTGNCNTGNYNSGRKNSGNLNAGDFNAGNCNAGYYNTGDYNAGIFNTDEPLMRAFNKECNMTYLDFISSLNYSFLDLCGRIYNKNLLRTDRAKIEALPNYDPEIFTKITGIKFDECKNTVEKEECNDVDAGNTNELIVSLIKEVKSLKEEIKQLKNKEE